RSELDLCAFAVEAHLGDREQIGREQTAPSRFIGQNRDCSDLQTAFIGDVSKRSIEGSGLS
ncbi:MAG: hypothetical protein K0U44_00640, partial [Actinomycetia bacterium]|nr:hypothetical protein [Actinomycetes bacterium]